jgi:hypothetical protein
MARFTSSTERPCGVLLLAGASVLLSGCLLGGMNRQPERVPYLGGETIVQPPSPIEKRRGSLWRNHVSAN